MNINKQFFKEAGIFLLFIIGFWAISALYLKPSFDDKVLTQGDMQQTRLMKYAAEQYKLTHNTNPGWVDGMFSGMPSNLIVGIPTGNFVYTSGLLEMFHLVTRPVNFLFIAMLSMFVLLLAADVNRWFAAAGAIGYAFMTFSITSYEAGHITKVLAMAVIPGVVGGLVLISRRKYLLGGALTGIFFALLIGYFHYQIAYYAGIIAGLYVLVEITVALRQKDYKHGIYVAAYSVAMLTMGALSNIGKLIDTSQYAEATMRGGSEVASEQPKGGPKQQIAKKGLEKDYAFSWSYGIQESFTLLVPRYMGGSSREDIGENDLTGEEPLQGLYWGDLQFTSGPVYIGAIFIFLFILAAIGLFKLKKLRPDHADNQTRNTILWFSIVTTLVSLFLAWGRYFPINDLLFDYLPYYNKFRTPMMAFTIAQVVVPFFGLYGLSVFVNADLTKEEYKAIMKTVAIGIGSLLGLGMLMLFFSDFNGAADAELKKSGIQAEAMKMLKDYRRSEAWMDMLRSVFLIAVTFGLVFYTAVLKKKQTVLWVGLIVLVSFDMIGVSKRYLNDTNWQDKEEEEAILPSQVDEALMKINKDHSRVFDLRFNPFNDAHSAPWHRGIGGYHPAKLSRYQDLISYCITPNGGQLSFDGLMKNNALDMLNCKYILAKPQDGKGADQIIPRESNLGNAWFVKRVVSVPTAKAALETINTCIIADEVVIEQKADLKPASMEYVKDSNTSLIIVKYSSDTINYVSKNSSVGFAVFSEIYYNQKNGSWKATIDGKAANVMRVNYILRGIEVPAGEHKIEFVLDFKSNRFLGVEKISSGILLLLLACALLFPALGIKIPKQKND